MAGRSYATVVGGDRNIPGMPGQASSEFPSSFYADMARGTGSGFLRAAEVKEGFPALFYSEEEVERLAEPFKLALIGKFQFSHPRIDAVREWVHDLKCKGAWKVGTLDGRHILFTFSDEGDYSEVFAKVGVKIRGRQVKFLKWTVSYDPAKESHIAPIWINLPKLKPLWFNQQTLFSIGRALGSPLKLDTSTSKFVRPSEARILIERDVTLPIPEKIWLGSAATGYWQFIRPEFIPHYCTHCCCFGHRVDSCFLAHPELRIKYPSRPSTFSPVGLGGDGVVAGADATPHQFSPQMLRRASGMAQGQNGSEEAGVPSHTRETASVATFTREALRATEQVDAALENRTREVVPPAQENSQEIGDQSNAGTFTLEALKVMEQVEGNLGVDLGQPVLGTSGLAGSFTNEAAEFLDAYMLNNPRGDSVLARPASLNDCQDPLSSDENTEADVLPSFRVPDSLGSPPLCADQEVGGPSNFIKAVEAVNSEWQVQKRRRGRPRKADIDVFHTPPFILSQCTTGRQTRSRAGIVFRDIDASARPQPQHTQSGAATDARDKGKRIASPSDSRRSRSLDYD